MYSNSKEYYLSMAYLEEVKYMDYTSVSPKNISAILKALMDLVSGEKSFSIMFNKEIDYKFYLIRFRNGKIDNSSLYLNMPVNWGHAYALWKLHSCNDNYLKVLDTRTPRMYEILGDNNFLVIAEGPAHAYSLLEEKFPGYQYLLPK